MQWTFAIRYRDQVIGAECSSAIVAVELIAAWAEEFAAGIVGAGVHRKHGIAYFFVVFDGQTVEIGFAFGAGCGSEVWAAHAR